MGVKGGCGDCRSGLALGGGGYLLAGYGQMRWRPRGSEGSESDGGDGRGRRHHEVSILIFGDSDVGRCLGLLSS
jgi:hypothetical protein